MRIRGEISRSHTQHVRSVRARSARISIMLMILSCHSNCKNITRIAHSYGKNITQKSTLENSNLIIIENSSNASRSNTGTGSTQGSLLRAIDRTETSMGRRLLQEWLRRPLRDPSRIVSRQRVVRDFVDNHDVRLRT